MTFDAFHVAGFDAGGTVDWQTATIDASDDVLRWPRLQAADVTRIARELRAAGAALRARPVAEIVRVIDTAVATLFDRPASLDELTRLVAGVTGYSTEMTALVLARMAADWRAPALHALLRAEFDEPDVLDGFQLRDGRSVHAAGADLSVHIFSGNVPGVAVTSIIRALLVKTPVLGKTASGERVLAAAFARALYGVDAEMGRALAVVYWEGGAAGLEAAAFEEADLVVHYGGSAAIQDVGRRAPAHVRIVEHGARISFGMVAREMLDESHGPEVAREVALAAATFDQQGCVSPHVVFAEAGGAVSPDRFAALVADAFEAIERTLPRGRIAAAEAAAIRNARDTAEFRSIAGHDTHIRGAPGLEHTVIYDATAGFSASCLNRTLTIHPLHDLADVVPIISPYADVLQSAAVAARGDRIDALAPILVRAGVTRITTFPALPWPPPAWHHDGRGPLRELVRWVDLER